MRLRMFSGPNGSGKSHLIQSLIDQRIPILPLLNADEVLLELEKKRFIDLRPFGLTDLSSSDWSASITTEAELKSRKEGFANDLRVRITNDVLIVDGGLVNGYSAALIVDFLRYQMLSQKRSFSFETVMSHRGKLDFLKKAKEIGYKTYLYYIATESAEINVNRVENRVIKGGHDVPSIKTRERYTKSIGLLREALSIVDSAYVMDNSGTSHHVFLEKKNGEEISMDPKKIPLWFEKVFSI